MSWNSHRHPSLWATEQEQPQGATHMVSNCTKRHKGCGGGGWQLLLAVKEHGQEYPLEGTKTVLSLP